MVLGVSDNQQGKLIKMNFEMIDTRAPRWHIHDSFEPDDWNAIGNIDTRLRL